MNAIIVEYLLKGIFLGLCAYGSIQAGRIEENREAALLSLNAIAWSGFGLALAWTAIQERKQLLKGLSNPVSYLLYLILEYSGPVYNGILLGVAAGIFICIPADSPLLAASVISGAGLGLSFAYSRRLRRGQNKTLVIFGFALAAGTAIAYFLGVTPWNDQALEIKHPFAFSLQLLGFLPLFYVLAFSAIAEETEVEIGSICVLMGLALGILTKDNVPLRTVGFLLPVGVFFIYTMRILPALRILKHVLRGLSYSKLGQQANALRAFQRALQLDPANQMAKNNYWKLHAELDPAKLDADPETMALVDCSMCLDRVGSLLASGKPDPLQHAEAQRLIDLARKLRPALAPSCDYHQCVLALHDRDIPRATTLLEGILRPPQDHFHPSRTPILYPAWNLALSIHPEMKNRVGFPLVRDNPSCRMEAIMAVEKHLALNPEDQQAWALKRFLYSELTPEHLPNQPDGLLAALDHLFLKELGLATLEQKHDPLRAVQYMEMASRGLPLEAPFLFVQAGKALDQAGDSNQAIIWFEKAAQAGRLIGSKSLPEPSRLAYFSAVKFLADHYLHCKDNSRALEYYHLFAEFERSGVETLRTLANLHEEAQQPLAALRATEQALIYQPDDKDLLSRKERYLFSINPEDLRRDPEHLGKGFDTSFCLRRSKAILDGRLDDPEWMEFARHLAELVTALQPDSRTAQVTLGRALLRQGERAQAKALFEKVMNPKPERFGGSDDEDAWYTSCQLLADLYMELEQYQDAVNCLQEFRKSPKSGARTWLRLGQALEKLGDTKKALACYEQATAYEGNPNALEAQDALYRLR